MNTIVRTLAMNMGIGVLKLALPFITAELRNMMIDAVCKWDAYAKQTPYDWDNQVVDAIQALLNISDPEPPTPAPVNRF